MEVLKRNSDEIIWHLVNSFLAGALVVLGSLAGGDFSWRGVVLGFVAGVVVMVTKLKEYWDSERKEYCRTLFCFV